MNAAFLIVFIVIAILLLVIAWMLYWVVKILDVRNTNAITEQKNIYMSLDRIGSIMRENQLKDQIEEDF